MKTGTFGPVMVNFMVKFCFAVAEESDYDVPCPIRKAVQKQNLECMHHKAHFSLPYFQFIKQLLNVNAQYLHQCVEQHKKLTVSRVPPILVVLTTYLCRRSVRRLLYSVSNLALNFYLV